MASDNTFHLTIASVGETRYDGRARSAIFPGAAGEMTILPHHEPLVTTLKSGRIKVTDGDGSHEFAIEDGVLECSGNRAIVIL